MGKFDVISVGSAVVDVFVFSDVHEHKHSNRMEMCYPVGEKMLIKKIYFMTGGGGTNTSVGFSRLGLRAGFLGKTGVGNNSDIIMRELHKDKVEFLGVRDKKFHTGYSVILDSHGKDRTILTFKGANDELKLEEINLRKLNTKWFYFSSLMKESFKTMEKLSEYASRKKIKIAYNPSSYQCKRGARYLSKILGNTEILVLNKQEAEMLSGRKEGKVFSALRKLGPKIVCVTDGIKGNKVFDGIHLYSGGTHKNIKCSEKTGAGDAFSSGFVGALIKGEDIERAMQFGSANAESVIQHLGAKNKLLKWKEAEEIIKKKPVKVIRRVMI